MIPKRVCLLLTVLPFTVVWPAQAQKRAESNPPSEPHWAHRVKEGGVDISEQAGKLVIQIGGLPFAEYHYQEASKPYLFPVLGPDGEPMTRNWPMKDTPGEEHDHPHHRSLWFAHGEINGVDFWSESPKAGRTVHEKFDLISSGPEVGIIKELCKLVTREGQPLGTEEYTLRFYNRSNQRLFDFDVIVRATETNLVFGDTKEGTMAVRLAETMRLTQPKNRPGAGHIVNSEGIRDGETWGKRANWCDYYGPVGGRTVGIAIFDHPDNPRHPTWWHVRDYGLFAANPFGIHDFEKKPPESGNLTLPFGSSISFRYRFYIHDGDEKQADVAGQYLRYLADTMPRPSKPRP